MADLRELKAAVDRAASLSELKGSYYEQAVKNLHGLSSQLDMFSEAAA